MAFFDNLTISLKQQWLQFFQVNRSWLTRHMEVESVYTPDGGRRPPSYLILGVVSALEPQLAELMLPFTKLNPDVDALIDVLELNFAPDLVLGNRFNPQAVLEELSDDVTADVLIAVAQNELSDMSLDEIADEVVLVETDDSDEAIVVMSEDEVAALTDIALDAIADEVMLNASSSSDALGGMSLEEIADAMGLEQLDEQSLETPNTMELDAFGGISLNDLTGLEQLDEQSSLETPSATDPDKSDDLSSDVWDEGTSSESEQANAQTHLGEEKQPEHDSEISRLFPNS